MPHSAPGSTLPIEQRSRRLCLAAATSSLILVLSAAPAPRLSDLPFLVLVLTPYPLLDWLHFDTVPEPLAIETPARVTRRTESSARARSATDQPGCPPQA